MFQIRIKVISTKGESDENPNVYWIYPDKEMKQFAELKKVELLDMVLLHENDNHFNLIVSEDNEHVQLKHRIQCRNCEKGSKQNHVLWNIEKQNITD